MYVERLQRNLNIGGKNMSENKPILSTGIVPPVGIELDGDPIGEYEKYVTPRREKGYERFCKGCRTATPEAMKDFIADDAGDYDELFYCRWCDFIRTTGIDDILVSKDETLSDEKYDDEEYDEEDDGADALWELEDAGAFSDEGIMPGCHSGNWDYESEIKDIMQEFADMAFIGQCIKLAREKAGLSIEALANRLEMPESFIEDIENGEYIDRYGKGESSPFIMPIPVPTPIENSECDPIKEEEAWWKSCNSDSIKDKVADYLCDLLDPNPKQECDKDAGTRDGDADDDLPF